ncbi:hypothetical protein ACH5RR_037798 [Cinchona calisaya]|uniref:Uncharacterized protein n=1 Tax=Cinchona calisaya TaxID=153742 RepID=A0ABD2YAX3_9GENT
MELALIGRRFLGSEAKEIGLVSKVFESKEAMEEGIKTVAEGARDAMVKVAEIIRKARTNDLMAIQDSLKQHQYAVNLCQAGLSVHICVILLMILRHEWLINCAFVRQKFDYLGISLVSASTMAFMVFIRHLGVSSNLTIGFFYNMACMVFFFERLCEETVDFSLYTAFYNFCLGAGVKLGYVRYGLEWMFAFLALSFAWHT